MAAASTPRSTQRPGDLVAQPLGLAEHGELRDALADRADHAVLVHVVHGEEQVVHLAHRVGRRVDRHLDRIAQVVADEMADVAVERRREQHRLGAAGAVAQDPLDLRREPVVGHAVGLVEDDDVDVGERDVVRLEQVDQPQRRGDDDLDTFLQGLDLVVPAGPAVDGEDPLTGVLGDRFEHLGDLHGELPRRHEHEPARAGRLGGVEDAGEHRDTEGERLARARAGPAADVAALHRHGDGGGLDLERLGEPGGGEPVVDVRRDAELGEAGGRLDGRQGGDGGERRGARSVVVDRRGGADGAGGGARPAGGTYQS